MKEKFLFIVLAFSAVFAACYKTLAQCSCAYVTPDSKYVEIVFVGKILNIAEEDKSNKYRIQISEIFKGLEKQDTVEAFDSFYNCNDRRYVSREYLFMASRDKQTGKIKIIGCSYSYENKHQQKQMIEILRWKKNTQNQGGILVGKVTQFIDNEGNSQKPDGVDNVFVEGENGEKYKVKIESDGFYKLGNLKAGRYKVLLNLPESLITYGDVNDFDWAKSARYVNVSKGEGAIEDFSVSTNGIISGKVFDSNGTFVSSINVNLYRLDEREEQKAGFAETDEYGNYVFKGLSAGRYLIKVGVKDWYLEPDSVEAAYPITYFPNKNKKEKAEIMELGKAQVLKDKNIKLIPAFKKRLIEGKVLMEDARPAANADIAVQIKRKDNNQTFTSGWHILTETDSQGNFSFYAFDETEYIIEADIDKPIGEAVVEVLFSSKCVLIPKNGEIKPLKIVLKKGDGHCNEEDFGF